MKSHDPNNHRQRSTKKKKVNQSVTGYGRSFPEKDITHGVVRILYSFLADLNHLFTENQIKHNEGQHTRDDPAFFYPQRLGPERIRDANEPRKVGTMGFFC
ncbi:hypothetical protein OUZ56_022458 [Daphnia magna]|uniref:Uncharacterized protein n=1 Tax=Daphnia magna TaxID=35525 RepID=A0ABR0AWF3_9CRUS|nr:hypothetical protein OUZ56_022458 [Daphnia magna]